MYYFVTLLFVILGAKASFFDLNNICWVLIDVVILWVGLERRRFTKNDWALFAKFSLIYIAFCSVRSIFLTGLPLHFWVNDILFLFKYILTSFLFCALLKEQTIHYLVKVGYHLTIISLFCFGLQLVAGNTILAVGKAINLPDAHFDGYVNFLVFTYVNQHPFQNAGYSWEPGAFGFFSCMNLLLLFLTNNFTFDKRAKWISVAIITTVSTTTYVAFMVLILLFFRARGVKFAKLLLFIVPVLCVFAVSLPFLFDKIVAIYNQDMADLKNINTLDQWYVDHGQAMPLNRFASMLFIWQMFGARLIFGISNMYDQTVPILKSLSISNGIFSFFAQFGILGLGYLFYRAYQFFNRLTGRVEISLYCLLILLVFGFAECIYVTSFALCFYFLYHYTQPEFFETDANATVDELLKNTKIHRISAAAAP